MNERLVPTQLSEYGRCSACERVVPAWVADPPPAVSLYETARQSYEGRIGTWDLCPHCLSAVEPVLADLDRLTPTLGTYDEDRDHHPTACGRCRVQIDDEDTLLQFWGHGVRDDWYTGLCADCTDVVREGIAAVPETEPPGGQGVYWPQALTIPDEELVTAEDCDPAALRSTFGALTEGDTVRLSAYERGTIYTGPGQYLDVTARVRSVDPGGSCVVDPLEVHDAHVTARAQTYGPDPGSVTDPYRLDLGTDLESTALPRRLGPGDVPVVRTDDSPLAVTVLDRLDAPDDG